MVKEPALVVLLPRETALQVPNIWIAVLFGILLGADIVGQPVQEVGAVLGITALHQAYQGLVAADFLTPFDEFKVVLLNPEFTELFTPILGEFLSRSAPASRFPVAVPAVLTRRRSETGGEALVEGQVGLLVFLVIVEGEIIYAVVDLDKPVRAADIVEESAGEHRVLGVLLGEDGCFSQCLREGFLPFLMAS